MAAIVYYLCALTSLACAVLLLRSYAQRKVRLLLWSGICFLGFALNNALLIADRLVFPDRDLAVYRTVPALLGLMVLIYGLIWDAP
jgi:hypothetical protein